MNKSILKELVTFRQTLHSFPDLSGQEFNTAERVIKFIKPYDPDQIILNLGGEGVAFVYDSGRDGDVLMLRADLDALPIQEDNEFAYKSSCKGVSHKCGHDGHMAILAGVAAHLKNHRLKRGKLVLLYQPAEETGKGAECVIQDEKFKQITPDYAFALHNRPGLPEHTIAIKDKFMACASTGMKIRLKGKTAHASSPEDGNSPVEPIKTIHTKLKEFQTVDKKSDNFSLITTVGIVIGDEDYGIAPAIGELMLTVRAYKNELLESILKKIEAFTDKTAHDNGLTSSFSYNDRFHAVINDAGCTEIVKKAAISAKVDIVTLDHGSSGSEDFGRLMDASRKGGALFLLGAGEKHPSLHTPEYDFNDDILSDGMNIFVAVIDAVLGFEPAIKSNSDKPPL